MRVVCAVLLFVIVGLGRVTSAQEATTPRPEPLKRLDFLVGRFRMTGTAGTEKVDDLIRCEWLGRVLACRTEPTRPGQWPDLMLHSYNDRTKRYEGAFTDESGQVARHTIRWEGTRMVAEYEYYVGGAHRIVRRLVEPAPDGFIWTIEDLGDEKVQVAFQLKGTRLDR